MLVLSHVFLPAKDPSTKAPMAPRLFLSEEAVTADVDYLGT